MKHLSLFLGICGALILPTNGAKADPDVTIQQVNPALPVDQLAGPQATVRHRFTPDTNPASKLPSVEERRRIFSQANLLAETNPWDELDRDKLYMNAKASKTSSTLVQEYPALPQEKLNKLWKIIHTKASS